MTYGPSVNNAAYPRPPQPQHSDSGPGRISDLELGRRRNDARAASYGQWLQTQATTLLQA
jgi:hypothetical protein